MCRQNYQNMTKFLFSRILYYSDEFFIAHVTDEFFNLTINLITTITIIPSSKYSSSGYLRILFRSAFIRLESNFLHTLYLSASIVLNPTSSM